jgi:hypothetical protein
MRLPMPARRARWRRVPQHEPGTYREGGESDRHEHFPYSKQGPSPGNQVMGEASAR